MVLASYKRIKPKSNMCIVIQIALKLEYFEISM